MADSPGDVGTLRGHGVSPMTWGQPWGPNQKDMGTALGIWGQLRTWNLAASPAPIGQPRPQALSTSLNPTPMFHIWHSGGNEGGDLLLAPPPLANHAPSAPPTCSIYGTVEWDEGEALLLALPPLANQIPRPRPLPLAPPPRSIYGTVKVG